MSSRSLALSIVIVVSGLLSGCKLGGNSSKSSSANSSGTENSSSNSCVSTQAPDTSEYTYSCQGDIGCIQFNCSHAYSGWNGEEPSWYACSQADIDKMQFMCSQNGAAFQLKAQACSTQNLKAACTYSNSTKMTGVIHQAVNDGPLTSAQYYYTSFPEASIPERQDVCSSFSGVWRDMNACPTPPTLDASSLDLPSPSSSPENDADIILNIALQVHQKIESSFPGTVALNFGMGQWDFLPSCSVMADRMQDAIVDFFRNGAGKGLLKSPNWMFLTQDRSYSTTKIGGVEVLNGGPHSRGFAWDPSNPNSSAVVIDPWVDYWTASSSTGNPGYFKVAPSSQEGPFYGDNGHWELTANQNVGQTTPNTDGKNLNDNVTDSNRHLVDSLQSKIPAQSCP